MAQLDAHPAGDQEVVGMTSRGVGVGGGGVGQHSFVEILS